VELTSKLNPVYRLTFHTNQGRSPFPFIWMYDAQGVLLATGSIYGQFSNGQTDIIYMSAKNPGGVVDHITFYQSNETTDWMISSIDVTDLRTNVTTTLTVTEAIPFNTVVTIP
jgi:hypothetical protein